MSADHAEDIQKHVRTYMMVFGALAVLTVVTVGVSYIHLPTFQAVLLAMFIASIKGTLVAYYFMHLKAESKTIYWSLILCVLFFAILMILPAATDHEMVPWVKHASPAAHLGEAAGGH